MNSLKTLFVVAILGAVGYGVYVSLNRNPGAAPLPDGAPAWPEAPRVQIPGSGAGAPQYPAVASGAETAPPFSPGPVAAPGGTAAARQSEPAATGSPPSDGLAKGAPAAGAPGGHPGASGQGDSPTKAPGAANLQASGPRNPNRLRSDSPSGPAAPTSNPLPGRAARHGNREKVAAFMQAIQAELDEGRLAEAHLALSSLYDNPNVPPEQARRVIELLDQLAGTVIYSRQHRLEPPYRVRPGDTLESIAKAHQVPWQLLAKINGIRDRRELSPGRELKVLRGPFSAVVDLDQYELTLMLGDRYAGRFPIGVGRDHPELEGVHVVRDKIVHPTDSGPRAPRGTEHANNRSGILWIDLGGQIGIHGTNDPQNLHRTGGPGSICLVDKDIEDVFGILSVGSRVVIRR